MSLDGIIQASLSLEARGAQPTLSPAGHASKQRASR